MLPLNRRFPKTVYKYRDWATPFGRKSVTLCQVYFSSTIDVNDPWDCSFEPVFKETDSMQILDRIRAHVERNNPNWPEGKTIREVERVYRDGPWRDEQHRQTWLRNYRKYRATHFGILSLASKPSVNLMWSHYAAGHTGFCIGYSFEKLFDATGDLGQKGIYVFPEKVAYSRKYPEWNFLDFGDLTGDDLEEKGIEFHSRALSTKSADWRYEKEFRFLMSKRFDRSPQPLSTADRKVVIPQNVITSVYLGARMDPESKVEILRALNQYSARPRVYEAHENKSLQLEFREIEC